MMNFTVLCDTKPKDCSDCYFYSAVFNDDESSAPEHICVLTNGNNGDCPLVEAVIVTTPVEKDI